MISSERQACAGLLPVQQEAAMARPGLAIRTDLASASELRRLARRESRQRPMQRLLAVANALEVVSRAETAWAAGMERRHARRGSAVRAGGPSARP